MLVRLLGTLRHTFQTLLLALFQPLEFFQALLSRHRLVEKLIVEIRQILFRTTRREDYSVKVFRIRIHLETQRNSHLHLILQNGRSWLSSAHQMPTATGTLLEHHQPDLVLLRQDEVSDLCRFRLVVAVHIVEEETALTFASCQLALGIA